MDRPRRAVLTSVKRGWVRHPAFMAAGGAAVIALLGLNVAAFVGGLATPALLGGVIVADMLVIASAILVAAREVLVAEQRTEASQAQLASIVDSAMDAIVTIDEEQNIVLFNRAAEQVFRCTRDEALGAPLERFLPQRYRAAHRGHVEHFGRTGVTARRMGDVTMLWGLRSDGEEFPLEASISQTAEAGRRYFTVILRDISLRRQAEVETQRAQVALTEAQARLGAIVDSAMDAVITVDEAQKIVLFNGAAERLFEVQREQMLGTSLDRLIPARFRPAHRGHLQGFAHTGVTSRRMGDVTTLWAVRPASGAEFPIEASISQALEGGRRYFTVILRDITVRKEHEDALKRQQQELRELSARVLEAREEEKTHIARELHDELGQLLTALKMDLAALRQDLPAGEAAAKAAEMSSLLDQTVTATRRISADLRPLMLDDLGLADATNWLVEDFAKRFGVEISMQLDAAEGVETVSKPVATAVYRAVQESLTNIARHSGAKRAWVTFAIEDGAVQVEVEDDGRGVSPEDLAKARSLGLKGMRERITWLGGNLEIARAPRGGTRLRLRVPATGAQKEQAA
jgi:PAS domain S-box-containing protein